MMFVTTDLNSYNQLVGRYLKRGIKLIDFYTMRYQFFTGRQYAMQIKTRQ